ncbi:uncharacterized protein LOC113283735 [Papaver somniferum]|uniref:uncharacterized protein LOC113283735 n=1 Tax=Papaver somniferum TaxID=3469 RepID=UPI000E7041F5|nr:uncharacterized protein LOC113283735 [Papaver somniferum]XP_026388859.1 uncharacterized protein LOC113283735 [Papaver somniferum]XP_026388860.1 uncharacterized protein LOC113283735 [Papaver somniferum]
MRSKRLELLEAQQKQKKLSTVKSRNASVNRRRAKETVTDDAVDEERLNGVALEKQRSSRKKPRIAVADGPRESEIVTDEVDDRLNTVAVEKQSSAATTPCSAFISGRSKKNVAVVGERLNAIALEKQKSLIIKPRFSLANGRRAKEIVTDPVDERLNAVDVSLDSGCDIRDEDADILDADGDSDVLIMDDQSLPTNSNENADIIVAGGDSDYQIVEDQWLHTNSDEDADILDADGGSDYQTEEDEWLPTNSDEDADKLDADGDSDCQVVEDQSLHTKSDKVAGSSKKRKSGKAQRQVSDPHSESYIANYNDQGSTSLPSDNRIPIIFDKYGRPCDVGSEDFTVDIGRIVKAHCRPAIESWKIVPDSIKENIWKDIVVKYVVPEIYKPYILSRANKSWKNWKHYLRLKMDKYETIAEKKKNIPLRLIRNREDWESFVDFCNTDEDRKLRAIGKKSIQAIEFTHSCGRRGIYRKIYDLEKENPTGEVSRAAIFVDTHKPRNVNDPKMRLVKELVEANPDGQRNIDTDAVALVYGRDPRWLVRGMGGGVSRAMMRATAPCLEALHKRQQENRSLQSEIELLQTQFEIQTPGLTSTPSNQPAPPTQNCTSTLSNQSASHMQNRAATPSNQFASQAPEASNLPARSHLAPPASNLPVRSRLAPPASNLPASSRLAPLASKLPARSHLAPPASNLPATSRLAPPASNLPARSHLAPPSSNLPASSRLAPLASNLPARSHLAPPASNLPASSCFIKNFKGRTIALGSINAADPPMEHVYSLSIEEIFDRDADLFDEDGKLGDVMIGGVINWPKACVQSDMPAGSCFVRNFKRRIIAFGSFNTADSASERVYSVIVKEIYDRDAELFDEDGKLGEVPIGGVINWPKACIKPC